MFPRSRVLVAACTATAAFVVPAVAQAATKTVDMGTPPSAAKTLNQKYSSDVNDFFPHAISVHVGDKVTFAPTGFHTVDLLPKGGQPVSLVSPTGQKAAVNDAAGNPFWFNGQDVLSFTPSLAAGLFGKSVSYSGAKRVESGLPLAAKPKPFSVKFTKAGTFTYLCDVHPGMKGVVHVLPKSKPVPSAAADAKTVKAQVAAAIKSAKALAKTTEPAGTVGVGAAGKNGVEYYGFFPSTVTVPTGTTLTFKMSKDSYEDHTATTGPGDPEKPGNYLGDIAASLQSPTFSAQAVYPSDTPGTTASLTPTLHGNGFWSSGFMDVVSGTPQPESSSVTFSAPGTYQFYCLIHPFMHATVTVQ